METNEFGINQALVEEMHERWQQDPSGVDASWCQFFARREQDRLADVALQDRVHRLIAAYRERGHLRADLDPLALAPRLSAEDLAPAAFSLGPEHLDTRFACGDLGGASGHATLREIVARLRATYCRTVGVELAHIEEPAIRAWLQERMEATENRVDLTREDELRVLRKLTEAELFEQFIHTKFLGAKRFSLEGSESLIPLIDLLIEEAVGLPQPVRRDAPPQDGGDGEPIEEIVIAMAHRGRLNVLANTVGKDVREIFAEFEDQDPEAYRGGGDVKYHLGYSIDRVTPTGRTVHLSLAFNPSHLEWGNPVALGRVRAKQDRRGDADRRRVLPLLIHGDAAFAGQGLTAETLNLSRLAGYGTGGTIHVVVNNQIGFTTVPTDARSTRYATDVCRMLDIPIFHVNGEDPRAVAWVARLAARFRQEFSRDIVIDLWCYRKYGHNEADEPAFTAPLLYDAIAKKPSVRAIYVQRLVEAGRVTADDAARIEGEVRAALEGALADAKKGGHRRPPSAMVGLWSRYRGGRGAATHEAAGPTAVPEETLRALLHRLARVPEGFHPHPKLERMFLERRREMAAGTRPLDWAAGEALGFATLLAEGTPVRVSGQDSRRGTFSHRHAALADVGTGASWVPLADLSPGQARFEIWDSPLSEAAVLGFDYGYSLDYPEALVVWEAQFGDFVNAAQVVIDQFISSAEDKWNRLSGVVLLLPHGFEGQGPEHSSARLERFLQLCAEENMQVVNLTTPAQVFHALRRQVVRPYRKPLIVMSPKSLLRHPTATSTLGELATGSFARIIGDGSVDAACARRVLLCSGKIYYELEAARRERHVEDVAIVRLEQLYPLTPAELGEALKPYGKAHLVWVQEEPWNMGAWFFLRARFPDLPLECIARQGSASPATGSAAAHKLEQRELVDRALAS
ncbi:MAG: 2-oxoglutarate dehydrogenase E1 component [Myxococcota bacterium]